MTNRTGTWSLSTVVITALLMTANYSFADTSSDNSVSDAEHRRGIRIEFYPHIGPTRVRDSETGLDIIKSPSYDLYAANAMQAILAGKRNKGGNIRHTPTAFNTLARNHVGTGEIIATEFSTWRGNLDPTGAFAAETGTFWRLGLRVISRTTFTLGEIRKIYSDSLDSDVYTMAETIGSFEANRAVGIYWGPDGRRGGGDDVVYDSIAHDAATTPLNVFGWLGNGKLDFITNETLSEYFDNDESLFWDDWQLFMSGEYPGGPNFDAPFFMQYLYEVGDPGSIRAHATYTAFVCDRMNGTPTDALKVPSEYSQDEQFDVVSSIWLPLQEVRRSSRCRH